MAKKKEEVRTLNCSVSADDGSTSIAVSCLLQTDGVLADVEFETMQKSLYRKIADVIQQLPFQDFGIENITVERDEL